MMTRGIYMDYDGVIHQFYEAESNKYYRLDICKQGTQFQVDLFGVKESILYTERKPQWSLVTKRFTRNIRNSEKLYITRVEMKGQNLCGRKVVITK